MKNNTVFVVASCSEERDINIVAFNDFKDAVISALTPLQQDIVDHIDIDDISPADEDLISKINEIVNDDGALELLLLGEQSDNNGNFGLNVNVAMDTCSVWSNLDDYYTYDALVKPITTITE